MTDLLMIMVHLIPPIVLIYIHSRNKSFNHLLQIQNLKNKSKRLECVIFNINKRIVHSAIIILDDH